MNCVPGAAIKTSNFRFSKVEEIGAEEMNQVKSLPCKHKDWNLDPQHLCVNVGLVRGPSETPT